MTVISHPFVLVGAASALVALIAGFALGWASCLHEAAKARPLRTACGDHPGNQPTHIDGTTAQRHTAVQVAAPLERQGL